MGFLLRVLINTLALYLASLLIPGIELTGLGPALLAGLVLGLVNAVIRPVLLFLTLPLTFLTLGLFILVLNGLLLQLVAWLVGGFTVAGFWASVFGAIVVGLVSWLLTAFLSDRGRVEVIVYRD
ncbi:MAG: phage holin family protein [Candidatus Rokubacteria bacterium]|nr:phage holin family protein [Candidatus Rokubacteria bacterium]MBI2878761.1 phage holin family protein [Candidatus Rokubacteria bacterium]